MEKNMTYEEAFKNLSIYAIRRFVANVMTTDYAADCDAAPVVTARSKATEYESYQLLEFIAKMAAQIGDGMTCGDIPGATITTPSKDPK